MKRLIGWMKYLTPVKLVSSTEGLFFLITEPRCSRNYQEQKCVLPFWSSYESGVIQVSGILLSFPKGFHVSHLLANEYHPPDLTVVLGKMHYAIYLGRTWDGSLYQRRKWVPQLRISNDSNTGPSQRLHRVKSSLKTQILLPWRKTGLFSSFTQWKIIYDNLGINILRAKIRTSFFLVNLSPKS